MTKQVKVVLGSVRTGRAGKEIADWILKKSKEYTGNMEFELIDLKALDLPFMDEPTPPMTSDSYTHDHTRKWSAMIKASDALVIVTPEYNHGYPPALKNAIDFLYHEWQGMVVGLVGYGGSGATHSIRQLREILEFVGMKVLEDQVTIDQVWDAVDEKGNVKPENTRGDILDLFRQIEHS